MDLGSVVGLVLGFLLIVGSILMGGSLGAFINIPSVLITIGGALAATLINYPMEKFMVAMTVAKNAFFWKLPNPISIVTQMSEFATIARKEGVLALEERLTQIEDPFVRKGVQMVVDGTAPDLTQAILNTDVESVQDRHSEGKGIFLAMGNYAPAFGMIGTLVGLVQMLQTMEDPSTIGTGMAVALLTTLYGAVAANLVCLPIAGKLKARSDEEVLLKKIVIDGVFAIQSGDSPRVVEEKLKVYLSPKLRQQMEKQAEGS